MPMTAEQRHALLTVERTRDAEQIAAAIAKMLEAAPGTTMLDAELAFRDGGAFTYLVAAGDNGGVKICIGIAEAIAALDAADLSPNENRAALSRIT
jgi:phage baseplate assembly protein gpV